MTTLPELSKPSISTKEVAAFDFISEMCHMYEYFDDDMDEETFVMSDHDIERDNQYSHNLKVSICNYLEDEGIIERKKEDDGFHICKRDIFIKYVVGHMATKAWPKRELLKYVNHYCKNGKQMGKLIMEAGFSLPVRTIQGDCKTLGGENFEVGFVTYNLKRPFPPSAAQVNLLPSKWEMPPCLKCEDEEEREELQQQVISTWAHIIDWKEQYLRSWNAPEPQAGSLGAQLVLLRKKVTYEFVSTVNNKDELLGKMGLSERSSKKRPSCDAEEPPAAKKKVTIASAQ